MTTLRNRTELLLGLALLSVSVCRAQLTDVELGYAHHRKVLSQHSVVSPQQVDVALHEVWTQLMRSPALASGPSLPYEMTVLNERSVNAFAGPGGHVYVNVGLAEILDNNPSLLASVIGHELGHCLAQHHYKQYLSRLRSELGYRRCIANARTNTAVLACNLGRTVGGLLELKLNREDEHEADRVGMVLMAQAGYHPAYALATHQRLELTLGNRSHLAAFFQGHPRHETRIKRLSREYLEALSEFEREWPRPEFSPGGAPPVLGKLEKPTSRKVKGEGTVEISVPVEIYNAKDQPVRLTAFFKKNGRYVESLDPEFANKSGNLAVTTTITGGNSVDKATARLSVPTAAVGSDQRKLKGIVAAFDCEWNLLDMSDEFEVNFPKIR